MLCVVYVVLYCMMCDVLYIFGVWCLCGVRVCWFVHVLRVLYVVCCGVRCIVCCVLCVVCCVLCCVVYCVLCCILCAVCWVCEPPFVRVYALSKFKSILKKLFISVLTLDLCLSLV